MSETRIWISWETQRRNAELADAFNCQYLSIDYDGQPKILRYFLSIIKTASAISFQRYEIVFGQCPSLVLILLLAVLQKLKGFCLVIDAHNAGLEHLQDKNPVIRTIARYCFRRANLTIVSNDALVEDIATLGIPAVALADRLPSLTSGNLPAQFINLPRPLVVLISTFAHDEPIEEILKGALAVEQPFSLVVTGKRSKAGPLLEYQSDSVVFSDFIPNSDYDSLISRADLLIDITDRHDCLVCGAYEAIAAGIPILLLDSKVNRQVFPKGCLYSSIKPQEFKNQIVGFFNNVEKYRLEMTELQRDFPSFWEQQFKVIQSRLAAIQPNN